MGLQYLQKNLQYNERLQTSLISVLREDVWILNQRRHLTRGKKPYCFICKAASSHLDPVHSDDEDDEEQQSSVSTEKQQIESSVSTEKPSRKRNASDVSGISPKRRRLDTRSKKTSNPWEEALLFHLQSSLLSPLSCTEMVMENRDKQISCDEPDSIVHIH